MNERQRQLHVGPGPCGQSPRPPANESAAGAARPHVGRAELPSHWPAGPAAAEGVNLGKAEQPKKRRRGRGSGD